MKDAVYRGPHNIRIEDIHESRVSGRKVLVKFKNQMCADDISKIIVELLEVGDITTQKISTGGRNKTVYRIKEKKE